MISAGGTIHITTTSLRGDPINIAFVIDQTTIGGQHGIPPLLRPVSVTPAPFPGITANESRNPASGVGSGGGGSRGAWMA